MQYAIRDSDLTSFRIIFQEFGGGGVDFCLCIQSRQIEAGFNFNSMHPLRSPVCIVTIVSSHDQFLSPPSQSIDFMTYVAVLWIWLLEFRVNTSNQ